MDQEISSTLSEHSKKLDAIYASVERMRKYFLWSLIITVVCIVLPLVGMAFVIPQFLGAVTGGGF